MMPDLRALRLLAALAASAALLALQPAAQDPQILSSSDCKSLNKKAKDYFNSWLRYEFETNNRRRQSAGRALSKAKESFLKDWDSRSRKGDPLASVPDLRAVFDGVFPYPRQSASGVLKQFKKTEHVPAYWLMAPKRYDEDIAYRSVVLVSGFDAGRNAWSDEKDYYDATWGEGELALESVVFLPSLDAALDLDTRPDFSQPGADEAENMRIRAILGTAGEVQRDFNLDRERMILDTGDGASAFALRLASYFPHRFAGLILRHPIDITAELRLGSLRGVPVLLLSSADTADACEAIAAKLNEMVADSCKVMEGKGAYPFTESQVEIEAWTRDLRRQPTPAKLTIEPNHDAFNDAFWVLLGVTEPLAGLPDDQKPRLVVEADKANNRITVDARGVSDFMLLLNDDLIDLGKEFTVSVNGTLFKEERTRSLTFLVDRMRDQFDPTWIFTTSFATTVPKVAKGETGK